MKKIISNLLIGSLLLGSVSVYAQESEITCSEAYVQANHTLSNKLNALNSEYNSEPEKPVELKEVDQWLNGTTSELGLGIAATLFLGTPSPALFVIGAINIDAARFVYQNAGYIALGTAAIGAVLGTITLVKYLNVDQKIKSDYESRVKESNSGKASIRKEMELTAQKLKENVKVTNLFLEVATDNSSVLSDKFIRDVVLLNPRLNAYEVTTRLQAYFESTACQSDSNLLSFYNLERVIASGLHSN